MRAKSGIFVWPLLLAAVMLASTSVILIKASDMPPFLLASARLLGAAAFLSPFYFRELAERRRNGLDPSGIRASLKPAIVPGAVIAVHFISWIIGARLTSAGNSTLIVNMNPVAMPFAAFFLSAVRPTRRELLATALATGGVLLMGAGDFSFSKDYFAGDAVCFASMLCFAAYLAFGRRAGSDGRLWTYLVPLYAVGGAISLAAAALTPGALAAPDAREILLAAGLVLGPTVVGHSVLNWAMTVLRPQTVSIVNLFQFVFAVIMAYFLYGEIPSPRFYPTTALILAGALLSIMKGKRIRRRFP